MAQPTVAGPKEQLLTLPPKDPFGAASPPTSWTSADLIWLKFYKNSTLLGWGEHPFSASSCCDILNEGSCCSAPPDFKCFKCCTCFNLTLLTALGVGAITHPILKRGKLWHGNVPWWSFPGHVIGREYIECNVIPMGGVLISSLLTFWVDNSLLREGQELERRRGLAFPFDILLKCYFGSTF